MIKGQNKETLTRIGLRSMLRGEAAIKLSDFTVVSRVISLRSLSKKIGKQWPNSDPKLSPKLHMI